MTQSKRMSLFEAIASTAIGLLVSMLTTAVVMPAYGFHITTAQNIQITAIYTAVSIIRGYFVRRAFNGMGRV